MRYLNKEVTAQCPICESKKGVLLYEVTSREATRHFRLERPSLSEYQELQQTIEKLWGRETCQVVNCKECDFTYSFPYVGGNETFYNLAYKGGGYPSWKFEFQQSYDTLKKLIKEDQRPRVLEVGAGNGSFLSRISPELIAPENVYATEYSEYGLKALSAYGFHTYDRDFRKMEPETFGDFFDFVFMFQVLEHLDNIEETFETILSITRPGAYVFIGVPNSERIMFNELNGALLDMPPNHVGRWTRKAFQKIADKYGLEVFDYAVEVPDFEKTVEQLGTYKFLRNRQKKYSPENLVATHSNRLTSNRFYSMKEIMMKYHKSVARRTMERAPEGLGAAQWVVLMKASK